MKTENRLAAKSLRSGETSPLQNRGAVATGSCPLDSTRESERPAANLDRLNQYFESSENNPVATAPRFCSQWLCYARLKFTVLISEFSASVQHELVRHFPETAVRGSTTN